MQYTLDNRLSALNQISQRKLVDILDKIPGRKDFIIDAPLIKPLERIIGVSKLRNHGVDKIYKLEKSSIPCSNTQRVFLIPSDLITLKRVCDKINSELRENGDGISYHIIFVSRNLGPLSQLLEEEGIYGSVSIYSFQWELMQLDDRVFSLEYYNLYKSLFVEGDQSFLPCIAKSLWTLQLLLGKPSVTFIQGKYAHLVDGMVKLLNEELGSAEGTNSAISCCVIIDRDIDYVSTLLTSATYSSLLDEVFGIKSGVLDIKTNSKDYPSVRNLNSTDPIYSQIKSRHFADVFPFLSFKIKEISAECTKSKHMAIQEMKQFVSNELQSIATTRKSLAYHIEACEAIINQIGNKFEGLQTTEKNMLEGRNRRESLAYIEENLAIEPDNKCGILRLMCLLSITQDGLFSDEVLNLKNQFLHSYGYQHIPCFYKLEKIGLFTEQPTLIASEMKGGNIANKVAQVVTLPTRRSMFYSTAQKLKLFPENTEDYDLKSPKDMGYVFSGSYIPLVCQLVHLLIKQEMSVDEISKLLPNCTSRNDSTGHKSLRSFIVYFIGGVTYAEISAFQLLEKLTGAQIIIAGTTMVNGNSLIEACL